MNTYLQRLLQRSVAPAEGAVAPRLPSRFEPSPFGPGRNAPAASTPSAPDAAAEHPIAPAATAGRLATASPAQPEPGSPGHAGPPEVADPRLPPVAPARTVVPPAAPAPAPPSLTPRREAGTGERADATAPPAAAPQTTPSPARRPLPAAHPGDPARGEAPAPRVEKHRTADHLPPSPNVPERPEPAPASLAPRAESLETMSHREQAIRPHSPAAPRDPAAPGLDHEGALRPRREASVVPPEGLSRRDERGAAEAPVIRITIGRVEVRAVSPPQRTAPPPPPRPRPPALSLDDYLKQRREDRR